MNLSLHNGDWIGTVVLMMLFLPFFSYAEEFEELKEYDYS